MRTMPASKKRRNITERSQSSSSRTPTQTIIAFRRAALNEAWMLRYMTATPREGWRDFAACRGLPLDMWYNLNNHPTECVTICETCPVRRDCGADAYADENGVEFIFGVRAGMSPATRQRLYRSLR